MLPNRDAAEIENIIGYAFRNKALLSACFTHSSYANTHGEKSNERLEFLGDAVLGFLVAERLYLRSSENEGRMTQLRQKLVAEKPLKECIERAGLHKYMLFAGGCGAAPGAKAVSSLFEALVAGIYLDGGMDEAEKFVLKYLAPLVAQEGKQHNYKGELQEFLQGRGLAMTAYAVVKTEGAAHAPRFTVRADGGGMCAYGEGGSKAEAEKAAAKALLDKLLNVAGEH